MRRLVVGLLVLAGCRDFAADLRDCVTDGRCAAERCDNQVDDDGDGRADCDDAACEGLPCAGGRCLAGRCAVDGAFDAGAFDASSPDSGEGDAGSSDAGAADAGASDAGLPDAGCRGCLSDAGCEAGADRLACGALGTACVRCDLRADLCALGQCRCGNGPSCAQGQRCEQGRCGCDAQSCSGCCAGNTCRVGSEPLACGQSGAACDVCAPPQANVCVDGECRCGAGKPCSPLAVCDAGVCVPRTWREVVTTGPRPAGRSDFGMAYDEARGHLVIFGGRGCDGGPLNDTWLFDGGQWSQVGSNGGPSPRFTPLVYQADRQRLLLSGGQIPSGAVVGETWAFDGAQWTLQPFATAPAPRRPALAYDPGARRVLLYGGRQSPSSFFNDLWQLDLDWTPLDAGTPPPPVTLPFVAFDPRRGTLVVTQGQGSSATFELVDGGWRTALLAPTAYSDSAAVYDPRLGAVWCLGGFDVNGGRRAETTLYDGGAWGFGPPLPLPLDSLGAAFDPNGQRVLVFGGATNPGTCSDKLWEL